VLIVLTDGEPDPDHEATALPPAVVSLALLVVLTLIAAVVAFVQRDNARAEARTVTARGLASAALANADTRLDLAQLAPLDPVHRRLDPWCARHNRRSAGRPDPRRSHDDPHRPRFG
jgi:hypothetical protein